MKINCMGAGGIAALYSFICIVATMHHNMYFSMHRAIFVVAWVVFIILKPVI